MRSATRRCCAPSWRSRSSRRRSISLAATMRLRDSRSSLSEYLQPASSSAFSCASSAIAPGGLQQLGLLGELGVVDDRRGRPAVALDLRDDAPASRFGDGVLGAKGEPEPRVAEGLSEHRLELGRLGPLQRCDHHLAQHPAGVQLGRDQREQEPVPDRRSRRDDRPLDDGVEVVRLQLEQARRLERGLRDEEGERDRRADRQRAPARRRAADQPLHDQRDRRERHQDHHDPAEAHHLDDELRLGRDHQPVGRAGRRADRDRGLP